MIQKKKPRNGDENYHFSIAIKVLLCFIARVLLFVNRKYTCTRVHTEPIKFTSLIM